jgi:L-alanine-DL-glutamate epimerase-like enolase superfamily enzyme
VLSLGDAIRFGKAIADLGNDYFEDPVPGTELRLI